MSLASDNFDRVLERRIGIHNNVPRIRNVTKSIDILGYLEFKKSENVFKSLNIMDGLFSASLPPSGSIDKGDLIYDRRESRYGYVTNLQRRGTDNVPYGYLAEIYMCNAVITIAHPYEALDNYNRKTIYWNIVIHHQNMKALISPINLLLEDIVGSKADKTMSYCYFDYTTTVHQGDRIHDGDKYYIVQKIADDVSYDGALKVLEMGIINV
jgi:hypothetical protein